MSESRLNNIPIIRLKPLEEALLQHFSQDSFQNFTDGWKEEMSFDLLRPLNANMSESIPSYLAELKKRKQLHSFILFLLNNEDFKPQLDHNPKGVEFKNYLDSTFVLDAEDVSIHLEMFDEVLIGNGAIPFMNRHEFRDIIKNQLLNEHVRQVAFVSGLPRSGMSYLGKYLEYICDRSQLFQYHSIDVSYYLKDVEQDKAGLELAECISAYLELDIDFSVPQRDKFKFITFIRKFNEFIENSERVPIIFLHDFHKIPVTQSIYNFMFEFVSNAIKNSTPEFNLIVAGFKCEEMHHWHDDLKYSCRLYHTQDIREEDVKSILIQVYLNNKDQIAVHLEAEVNEEEYVEGMLEEFTSGTGRPIEEVSIEEIGVALRSHLEVLTRR